MKRRDVPAGTLIAIDGVAGRAVMRAAAREASAARRDRRERAGISVWDASGIFGDLDAAGPDLERPSARTLMLLYAADLAFRIRWEIRPALAEGRTVIAAPYITTALALGRAMGLNESWLRSIFAFAPAPAECRCVDGASVPNAAGQGFVELACRMLAGIETRAMRLDLITRTHTRLKGTRHRSRP